jgi:cytochrome c biogenesis protein CcmG/thiol:disulfide interchange protein DsbE
MTSSDEASVGERTSSARRQKRPRTRIVVIVALATGLLAALIATGVLTPVSSTTASDRDPAHDFDLENLDPAQPRVNLTDFRGRPLVVNFWASWCVPCRQEMPALEKVHQRVNDRIGFVGIDHQDTRPEALAFVRETMVSYPSAFDPRGGTATDYALYGLPSTVFIAADGGVLDQHLGAYSEADLQAELDRLFPAP